MTLSEFLKQKAKLRDPHDLESVIHGGNGIMRSEIERLTAELRRRERALGIMQAIAKCDTGGGFGADTYARSFFVAAYAHDAEPRPTLTRLECVVVPDAIDDQFRHRPVPHREPAKAAQGVVTMTPTHASGEEIAREAAARYASGLRVGTYEDVLTEPCRACGASSAVCCTHTFDMSNEHQYVLVFRLCVRCPRVEEVASANCDYYESPPVLPPVELPQRYR